MAALSRTNRQTKDLQGGELVWRASGILPAAARFSWRPALPTRRGETPRPDRAELVWPTVAATRLRAGRQTWKWRSETIRHSPRGFDCGYEWTGTDPSEEVFQCGAGDRPGSGRRSNRHRQPGARVKTGVVRRGRGCPGAGTDWPGANLRGDCRPRFPDAGWSSSATTSWQRPPRHAGPRPGIRSGR